MGLCACVVCCRLRSFGIQTQAMISSYPYPPEFIDWMRFVFKNPDEFIATAVKTYGSLVLP